MAPSLSGSGNAGLAVSASATATTSSRSRPQPARKKAHQSADDAAYHAPASVSASVVGAGTKRAAGERAEGEPRVKRKRVEPAGGTSGGGVGTSASASAARRMEADGRISLVDFTTLPTDALYRYLMQFDLIPEVDPSPFGPEDPPPPSALLRLRSHGRRHASTASPAPSLPITPANRPRRDPASRRRSARLLEDDRGSEPAVLPVLADVGDVHGVLATIAQRHFRDHAVRETDTLASFLCTVKAKTRVQA